MTAGPGRRDERSRAGRRIVVTLLLVAVTAIAPMRGGEPRETDAEAIAIGALIARAEWSEAEAGARARLARLEGSDGTDSVAAARALDLLVAIFLGSGRYGEPEAKVLAARAVAIKEARLGPDAVELSDSLFNLGILQRRVGPVAEARKTLERALRIREQALGPASLPVAEALGQVGWSLSDTGDLPGAIRLQERALRIREDLLGPDDLLVAESLSDLGGAVRNAGDFPRAIELHQRALRIRRRSLPAGHPDTALSLFSVADAMHQDGDLPGALPFYDEALRLRRAAPILDRMRTSQVLIGLADLRRDLGDFEAARPLYEEAHRLRIEAVGMEHYLAGVSYQSYALFLRAAGDDAGARDQFESAIGIFDRTLPPGHPLQAVGRQGLGALLAGQGALEPARQVLQQAADIWKGVPIPNHPFAADTDLALGAVLRDLGQTAEARIALDRALANLAVSLGTDHPRYGEALLERARLAWREGQGAAALDGALLAESTLRRSLRAAIRGLSEGEALRYQDTMTSGLDLACSVASAAPGAIAPAKRTALFEALIRSRALVLDEIAARHRGIAHTATPQVARLNDAFEAARHRYARLLVAGPSPQSPGTYTALLTAARTDMERSERALAQASRDFVDLQRRQSPSLVTIARSLPSGTALISFQAYRQSERTGAASHGVPSYIALVLAPGAGAPDIVPLGAAAPVESRIERWRRDASQAPADPAAEREYRDAAADLRRALWDPVARRIGAAARVFVVPDGAVHAVALATLVDERGRYLVESGPTIHYLSAERDVLASPAAPAGGGLLALGSPDFDAASTSLATAGGATPPETGGGIRLRSAQTLPCAGPDALRFGPLPGSAAEAEEIGAIWKAASGGAGAAATSLLLEGREASEANFTRGAPGKRVLHLATHAFFIPSECDGVSPGPGGAPQPPPAAAGRLQAGTPLRVAGLALAGANHRSAGVEGPDDGLLTGEEISSLDLNGVEWVVLSGCQTGIGLARAGEGILGLRRSFQVAGARTLVMSLWPVSDNDTQAWMAELYRGRAAGASTANAVRGASRRIVEQRRKAGITAHPFFWGAFVAAGAWN